MASTQRSDLFAAELPTGKSAGKWAIMYTIFVDANYGGGSRGRDIERTRQSIYYWTGQTFTPQNVDAAHPFENEEDAKKYLMANRSRLEIKRQYC